jgi:hypothetical protein
MYHGGMSGLRVGDLLLPPSVTGVGSTVTEIAAAIGAGHVRADRVFVTSDRQVARAYAALKPNGALYRVEAVAGLEPDPDCLVDGLSWQCVSARVVSVVDPVVLFRSRPVGAWLRMANGGPLGETRLPRLPVASWEAGRRFGGVS